MDIIHIKNRIDSIFKFDQENCKKYRDGEIDIYTLKRLQDINSDDFQKLIETHEFPYKDLFGSDTYKKSVTLALHSNPNSMRVYHDIFTSIDDPSKIDLSDKAYFIDKFRVINGEPQLYGTQYKINIDKSINFIEIEDFENINIRRLELGMSSFEEYRNNLAT